MIPLLAGFALVCCAVVVLVVLAAVVWASPPAPQDVPGPAKRAPWGKRILRRGSEKERHDSNA